MLIVAGAMLNAGSSRIELSSDERRGVTLIRAINALTAAADVYRMAHPASLVRSRAAGRTDIALAALEGLVHEQPERLTRGAGLSAIAMGWRHLRREPAASDAQLSGWNEQIIDALSVISDRSNITFDAEIDMIDIGDAFAIQYPVSIERFAQLTDVIAHSTPQNTPLADRFKIARLESEALYAERLGVNELSQAVSVEPGLESSLGRKSEQNHRAALNYAERVDNAYVGRVSNQHQSLVLAGHRAVIGQQELELELAGVMNKVLAARIERERKLQAVTLAITVLFIAISFAIVAALMRFLALAQQFESLKAEQIREREIGAVRLDLWMAEEKFRFTFEQTPVGILIVNEDLATAQGNPALAALVSDVATLLTTESVLFARALVSNEDQRFERRYRRGDRQFAWAEVVLRGVQSSTDGSRYVLGIFRDVTESKALAERLVHDATHDALTGLPNRGCFENTVHARLERELSAGPSRWALFFLDLDDFKLVNDSIGHHAGDAVLVATAQRLRGTLRADALICRLAGDEFAILLPYDGDAETGSIATRIVHVLGEPLASDGASLSVRASIGIVIIDERTRCFEDALRDADTAMYQAKVLGGGRYVIFDASLHARSKRRKGLATDLRLAIDNAQIEVVYQPILDLNGGTVIGFEALARWSHPTEGSISPVEFIPIAEESGTIERLGAYMLLAACEQLAVWRRSEPLASEWTMNVNVAARQIVSSSIVDDLRHALNASGVPADRIILEITESVLVEHIAVADETLGALRELGAAICIDDFGTGYSSLQYLQRFPVDTIKIDRSFVSNGEDGLASEPIVQMLVTLSKALGLHIVVEGIETRRQLERLISLGCTTGQGFLFSRPVPAERALQCALELRGLEHASYV